MATNDTDFLDSIADYYSEKIRSHGTTPQGVDWNGQQSQILRFSQLIKLVQGQANDLFSIADFGCGYAAFYDFLVENRREFDYLGYDISEEMVSASKERLASQKNAQVRLGNQLDSVTDYVVASGIFNVQLETSHQDWVGYVESVLDMFNDYSSKGFAFNCLTSFSDQGKMRDYLYYADPMQLFRHCKERYSRNVALLHDYDLYEFTILVRK